MAEKVLLDTDIGTDIDDAVCLAYLLAQPECELLGITTVTGEAVARAKLASALCRAAGRDVPIYPGAEQPLLIPQKQTTAQQAVKLAQWPHQAAYPVGEAIEFLRATIRAHPHEVTLLTIAPLTNIALLFSVDPEIPALLKRLVLMCGSYLPGTARALETNARTDPHATALVYRAAAASHRSLGLDVTLQLTLAREDIRPRFDHPLLHPVLDFAEVWFESGRDLTFHDPLAAAVIFAPELCTYARGQVHIGLTEPAPSGKTEWSQDADGPHEIAVTVDRAAFFDHFFGVFARDR